MHNGFENKTPMLNPQNAQNIYENTFLWNDMDIKKRVLKSSFMSQHVIKLKI